MAHRLNTFVHVRDKDGANQVFGPDDTVPDWAVKEIQNDSVWDKGDSESDDDEDDTPAAPRRGRPPKDRSPDQDK